MEINKYELLLQCHAAHWTTRGHCLGRTFFTAHLNSQELAWPLLLPARLPSEWPPFPLPPLRPAARHLSNPAPPKGRGLTDRGGAKAENWGVELLFPVWSRPIREGGSRDQPAVSPSPLPVPPLPAPGGDVLRLFGKQSICFGPFCLRISGRTIFDVTGSIFAA